MHVFCRLVSVLLAASSMIAAEPTRILVVVGPSTHPPGSHEVAAGGRLLGHCLDHMENVPHVKAEVFNEWPADKATRDGASAMVFLGDFFPPCRLSNVEQNLADLGEMMRQGCGIVCLHFATGLRPEDVAENGDHPLLRWMGGYFAAHGIHHQSIAKIYQAATITPAAPNHPIARGWKEFTVHDEPYINNYFGPEGNKLAPNVTALATSMLPPDAPRREIVAWCVERADSGRGFAIVMPHFYKNWRQEDLRRFILNGIVWSAKLDIPAGGVKSAAPDLAAFNPAAVEFVPPPKPAGGKP
jgi:type 1 glutamine amidotransferase